MKRDAWGACVVIMVASACGTNVAQPINPGQPDAPVDKSDAMPDLNRGLVAHYTFDEEGSTMVLDSSGNGHAGIPINDPLPSTATPPVGFPDPSSRVFDGVGQYILVPSNDEMNFSGEITLAVWVYVAASTPGCHSIVAHGYCVQPPGEVFLRIGTDRCEATGTQHNWGVGSFNGVDYSALAPFYDLDVKVWLHIAGVYDGTTWRLYRNAVEIALQNSDVGAVPVASDWAIGARPPGVAPCVPAPVDRLFNGLIDDVRIYRRALGPSEILELYHL